MMHTRRFFIFFQLRPGLSDKGFHVNKLSSEFLKNLLGIFFLEKTNNCFEQRIKLLVYYLNCILVKFFNLKLKTKEFRIFRFFLSLKKAEFRVFLGLKDKIWKIWNFEIFLNIKSKLHGTNFWISFHNCALKS